MSMRDWFGKERRKHDVVYVSVTHELSESTQSLLEQLIEAMQGGGASEQLGEILNRVTNLGVEHTNSRAEIGMILSLLQGEAQQQVDAAAAELDIAAQQQEDALKQFDQIKEK